MADVLADLKNWSATASSNLPSGATSIGTGLDDNLRQLQATVRQDLASVGANIASAGTCDLGAVAGLFHTITGTTIITSFGTVAAGIWKVLTFNGALTITHNGTSLICPYGANITTTANDTLLAESLGSGNWKIHPFHVATLYASLAGATFTGAVAFPDGSASTPSVTHAGDLNCGLFFPAADTVAVATAGTERMRIDASGNAGFGYTSPSSFASSGLNVSIGTGAAAAALTVFTGTASTGAIYFADSASGAARYDGYIEYNQNTQQMSLGTASANSLTISSSGETTVVKPALLGYGTGAGGTVTQTTSKSTAVTLDKPTGKITMHNAALGAGASVTFDVNNSLVSSTDVISPTTVGAIGLNYRVDEAKTFSAGGGFRFTVTNITAGSLSEALVINFAVIKAVTA